MIVATNDTAFALSHLGKFVDIGIIDPFITLLASAASRDRSYSSLDVSIDAGALQQILDTKEAEAYGLIRTLVQVSPAAMTSFLQLVQSDHGLMQLPDLLETFAVVLELPNALANEHLVTITETAVKTIFDPTITKAAESAAKRVLGQLEQSVPDTVNQTVCGSSSTTFTPALARLASLLATNDNTGQGVSRLVSLGLRYLIRLCSSNSAIDDGHLGIFDDLSEFLVFVVKRWADFRQSR